MNKLRLPNSILAFLHSPVGIVLFACSIQAAMLALLTTQHFSRVLCPQGELFAFLLLGTVAVLFWSFVKLTISFYQKKNRRQTLCVFILAIGAQLPLAGCYWYTATTWWSDRVPHGWPADVAKLGAGNLFDLQTRYLYRHREESDHIIMFYNDLETPKGDLAQMESHVIELEKRIGRPLKSKIVWIRGRCLGQKHLSFLGFALGSDNSREIQTSGILDRHELAHAVLTQFRLASANPPTILHEGWAEANSGMDPSIHTWQLVVARAEGSGLNVQALFSKRQYHAIDTIHYSLGGAFVEFLLRKFTIDQFIQLYNQCTPKSAEQDIVDIYGVTLENLESQFWDDAENRLGSSD